MAISASCLLVVVGATDGHLCKWGGTMSASSSTPNLHLPVFSEDDIPTWLGDWNETVNTLDSIVAFKKVSATNGSNITGSIICIYNKVLKLMEIQGTISMTSGTIKTN